MTGDKNAAYIKTGNGDLHSRYVQHALSPDTYLIRPAAQVSVSLHSDSMERMTHVRYPFLEMSHFTSAISSNTQLVSLSIHHLREFVLNSRHPKPRRVWKGGSEPRS